MKNTKKYGIVYKVRNKINNKLYFGVTTQKGGFDRRYKNNIEEYTNNQHLKSSIKKYGIENFEIDKEFDVAYSKDELDKLEDMYIKLYNTTNRNYGYNKQYGGTNGSPSEETRRKISDLLKGENNPHYGKHLSEETKLKLSLSQKGEKSYNYGLHHSEESKKKISEALKGNTNTLGKHHSEETKLKMSNALKGENNYNYGKHPSEETKLKMSLAHIGKYSSEETRKKQSLARKGKKHTEETRRKMSLRQIKFNDIQAEEIRRKYSTFNYTQIELAKEYLVSQSIISCIINFQGVYAKIV